MWVGGGYSGHVPVHRLGRDLRERVAMEVISRRTGMTVCMGGGSRVSIGQIIH
jgi:hypothetical protein